MLYSNAAIVIGMTYVYLPLMVLPIYAAMERFDFRYVEAGFDLYASRSKSCGELYCRSLSQGNCGLYFGFCAFTWGICDATHPWRWKESDDW